MLPPLYLCSKCGYAGRLVLEIDSQDLARDLKNDDRTTVE
jgi:hypothetical protein